MSSTPEPKPGKLNQAHEAAKKAYGAADRTYQFLVQPDRPLEPETTKNPVLAGFLSGVLVGAGQLYNRQLIKAILLFGIFYLVGLALVIAYLIVGIWIDLAATFGFLLGLFVVAWVLLWLYAVVDAFLTARALKTGQLIVRYSLKRQGAHLAAGWVPFAGEIVPCETVRPDELERSLAGAVIEAGKQYVLKRFVIRVARYSCLILGAVLLIAGLVMLQPVVATIGGAVFVLGLFLLMA